MGTKRPASSMDEPTKKPIRAPKPVSSRNTSRKQPQSHTNRQRQHRLSLGGNTTSQKTLTQIDFVRQNTTPQDILGDLDFQEIEDPETFDGDDDDNKSDIAPRVEAAVAVGRKGNNRNNSGVKKEKRKGRYADRTLTQMVNTDFSDRRRILRSTRSRKRPAFEMEPIAEESEEDIDHDEPPRKKIQLDCPQSTIDLTEPNEVISETKPCLKQENAVTEPELHEIKDDVKPATPQKPRRFVVPSSQSPDSPEITFNTPQKPINSPIHFPLSSMLDKRATHDSVDDLNPSDQNGEVLSPIQNVQESQLAVGDDFGMDHRENGISHSNPTSPLSPIIPVNELTESSKNDLHPQTTLNKVSQEPERPSTGHRKRNLNVVYETDGDESETDSFRDAVSQVHQNQHQPHSYDHMTTADDHITNDGSLHHSSLELNPESADDVPFSTFKSDISLLYARRPPSYPYERFNGSENADLDHTGIPGESYPPTDNVTHSNQTEPSLPQHAPATTSSPNEADIATQSVPETFEVQQNNDSDSRESLALRSSSPLVHIESSQLPDNDADVGEPDMSQTLNEPRGILTASQLLTDSLMESVPGPPAWVSSQDNIDEDDVN